MMYTWFMLRQKRLHASQHNQSSLAHCQQSLEYGILYTICQTTKSKDWLLLLILYYYHIDIIFY